MTAATMSVDWTGALCAQTDPESWFPNQGGSSALARRVCGSCPMTGLQGPCLADALAEPEMPFGVRAGLGQTKVQRMWLRLRAGESMQEVLDQRRSQCPHCGKGYARLDMHLRDRHPEVIAQGHACPHCGVGFATALGLTRHLRTTHRESQ